MKQTEDGIVLRTSRISYLANYFITFLVIIILFLIFPMLDILGNLLHLVLFFGILIIGVAFAEQPEWEILFKKYIVTDNELIKLEGILNKKKTVVPFQNVSDVSINKSLTERLLNIGTVYVRGMKESGDIVLKGMKKPEYVHELIQEKINLIRETTVKAWKQH